MDDEYARGEILDAPNPERPDNRFKDGKGIGVVSIADSAWPTFFMWGYETFVDGLVAAVFAILRTLWWTHIDREPDERFKVIAMRSPTRFAPFFTVAIEFCDDHEQAKVVQRRMLEEWPRRDYAHARTIGRRRRQAIRLATLRGEAVPLE